APPPVPPEPVTRPVAASPPRYYDAPEPRRRAADGDLPASANAPTPVAEAQAERQPPSVVARVGRESEHLEELGPPIEIPLEALALPKRRPDQAEREEAEEVERVSSAHARRARLQRLRRMRREQLHARKRAYNERQWIPEALYGNRFLGMERLLP